MGDLRIVAFIVVSCCAGFSTSAQPQSGQDGLESENILIEKQFEGIIKDAVKVAIPPVIDEASDDKKEMQYEVPASTIDIPYNPAKVRPVAIPRESPEAQTHSYLKAGFGNKLLALVDAAYHDRKPSSLQYGAYYRHLSAKGKRIQHQRFSDNEAGAYVGYHIKNAKLGANFDYVRNIDHFYGHNLSDTTLDRKDIRQRINTYSGGLDLNSIKRTRRGFEYKQRLGTSYLTAGSGINEFLVRSETAISKKIEYDHTAGIALLVDVSSLARAQELNRTLVVVKPNYQYDNDDLKLNGAASVIVEDDVLHLFPDLRAQKKLIDDRVILFGGWKLEFQKNSFQSLVAENPYINDEVRVSNSRTSDLYIGFEGAVKSVSYNVEFSNKRVSKLPLFINDPNDPKRFNVFYEPKSKIVNVHGEVGCNFVSDLRVAVGADYYSFNNEVSERAWQMPQFTLNFVSTYHWKEKVKFEAEFFHRSGAFASVPDAEPVKLRAAYDINLGAEYKFSDNLSFFADLNNLASIKHERWLNYPTFGFTGMVGARLSY